MLFTVPCEALAHILMFSGACVGTCCASVRATCLAGAVTPELCSAVARHLALDLPERVSAPRTRARCGDRFRALATAQRRRRRAEAADLDREAWALWLKLHAGDCAAKVRKVLDATPKLATHKITFFADRTLAFLAAWRGRPRALRVLADAGADLLAGDTADCTPLIVAAWAGRHTCVAELLHHPAVHADAARIGEPPQTSSCGGKGPKTALDWATRKGFVRIQNLLRVHGLAGAPGLQA
ncbi:hypothetical protein M885DRAFT_574892 [Pelagophyceae sp. CCMP2097]|nr:hypothetical protein M885DRAFT_574892 [Pelagophyceae sp. CCMP2097]|mmetsp:Transcript_15195/g.54087  ORF Transcript_15195/g.54087 Transcript_15195/m.54087 type:complete len:240 (+) Transcript_15195:212-931(+)